jgi:hypothetical protein
MKADPLDKGIPKRLRMIFWDLWKEKVNRLKLEILDGVYGRAPKLVANIFKVHFPMFVESVSEELKKEGYRFSSFGPEALPKDTIYCFRKDGFVLYVIEQPPCIRHIKYKDAGAYHCGDIALREYDIALPFVVFFVLFRNGLFVKNYVVFRKEKTRSWYDQIFLPALPNVLQIFYPVAGLNNDLPVDFSICYGSNMELPIKDDTPKDEAANIVIDAFWNNIFNTDAKNHFEESTKKIAKISTWERWQKETTEDPNFILGINWIPDPKSRTILSFVGDIIGGAVDETLNQNVVLENINLIQRRFERSLAEELQEEVGDILHLPLSTQKETENRGKTWFHRLIDRCKKFI